MLMSSLTRSILRETYVSENSNLLRYLTSKPVHISDHWELLDAWREWDGILEELNIDPEQIEEWSDNGEIFEKLCYPVDDYINQHDGIKESYADYMCQHHPDEAPTWAMIGVWDKAATSFYVAGTLDQRRCRNCITRFHTRYR